MSNNIVRFLVRHNGGSPFGLFGPIEKTHILMIFGATKAERDYHNPRQTCRMVRRTGYPNGGVVNMALFVRK